MEFALKDAAALAALLEYDWRQRELLTDEEMIGGAMGPGVLDGARSTSVLRAMRRLRWIAAAHGVRPHGGRMRLWRLQMAMRAQLALDLRVLSALSLAQAIEGLKRGEDAIVPLIEGWRAVQAPDADEAASVCALTFDALIDDRAALDLFARVSLARFVERCALHDIEAPAFLRPA